MSYVANKYSDTAAGARKFIEKETILKITESTTYTPDPSVAGVWKVDNLREEGLDYCITVSAIIYMAGYNDPFGRTREDNDFEVGGAR